MRAKELKVSIQKAVRIIIAIISLIVLIISSWIIIDCFNAKPTKEKVLYNYNTNNNVDYKVYLKNNRFYEKNYMEKGKKYLTSIIDYIDINFNYSFTTSKITNNMYSYGVKAVITSTYELNGTAAELWSKSYDIIPNKTMNSTNTTGFQINENIKLDYNQYNEIAKKFKEEYAVSADTILSIVVAVKNNSSLPETDVSSNESQLMTLDIPLNKTVTDVTIKGNDPLNKNVTETIVIDTKVNKPLLTAAIVLVVIFLPIAAVSFYKLFTITNLSQYLTEQKKILKSFGDIIAEVASKPSLNGLKIIEVKKFEDLINIEEELRVPILFYESQSENESWFLITTDTQAYRYILKSDENMSNIEYIENNVKNEYKENILDENTSEKTIEDINITDISEDETYKINNSNVKKNSMYETFDSDISEYNNNKKA